MEKKTVEKRTVIEKLRRGIEGITVIDECYQKNAPNTGERNALGLCLPGLKKIRYDLEQCQAELCEILLEQDDMKKGLDELRTKLIKNVGEFCELLSLK